MVIGVDAGSLSITDERLKVGVWRVTFNLLKEFALIDKENEYRLFSFQKIDREVMNVFGPNVENKVITPATGWSSFWLPLELKRRPVDIFLGLSQSLPNAESHNIGFIYDLAFFYEPAAYGKSFFQLKKQTDDLVKRANHIITISHASKRDILERYAIEKDRVTVCYPGVDEQFSSKETFIRENSLPYFLFVGSLNRAKDIPLALHTFALFLKKIKQPYDFLLIGGDYWPDPAINESIHLYQLEDRVKRLGFITDEELPMYYRGATAFFTTAVREGFCLPAVESMACGTPVVAVDRGAMKEVVGDGGLVASSIDSSDIADLLFTIATKQKQREILTQLAMKRAQTFSWKSFAACVYDHMVTR